ncbi:MAG: adenylyltransferase/cytidyltransferase family protein [Candidatus Saganbacteria bacterium]|nr:adenylyltransferase/cytidyltransferase family protein [Candidatus Saganbacteria bacterium]
MNWKGAGIKMDLKSKEKWIKEYDSIKKVKQIIKELSKNKVVVYTYGVWDIIHPGHIKLLVRARELGDFLIVGVVEDEPVRKLKGDGRPVQLLADRLFDIAALGCVDAAIVQKQYDPTEELNALGRVDILAKGDDWKNIPGTEAIIAMGGKLVKLPYSPEHSTSSLVSKITGKPKSNHGEPKC